MSQSPPLLKSLNLEFQACNNSSNTFSRMTSFSSGKFDASPTLRERSKTRTHEGTSTVRHSFAQQPLKITSVAMVFMSLSRFREEHSQGRWSPPCRLLILSKPPAGDVQQPLSGIDICSDTDKLATRSRKQRKMISLAGSLAWKGV